MDGGRLFDSNKPKPTKEDAYAYVRAVRDHFHNDRKKYEDFLAIMKDFKTRKISRVDCIRAVLELLNGDRDLISGFNAFLPFWMEIMEIN
ncbi:Paired amphipathic helix [Arabidopsis thaliana x Arabidopsis arenosa]|uniref:Paired amphipathic helix n=1 Tax=Arabidopsis thaliana x Arabidopsis arenosa TaxID=1240361 RepID=A0A8T2C3I7_9BRAS|nr:Paired amphipathic helix [Arabidopsis thaliana x Arabidopsis arenosa]